MSIRQLAPDVAAKIAAGEVVERPASVVKELIENSIDAGATQIRVDLTHGGLQLIRVTDNGGGIVAAELPLALARHATSKVEQIDDLEQIRSLGFRGEALASIAAVAEVMVVSRLHGMEQGAQISATNGQMSDIVPAACAEGTVLTVRNLFSAVPARRKFLKSRNTEVSHCHHLLEQYALAYPEIRFSVWSENRQILTTPGNGRLDSVLLEVYGLQIAEQMVPMGGTDTPDDPEKPVVSGYVSRPTCYKRTRQCISFFVNRRWVMSRMLTAAVEGAYHSLLLSGRHPIAVVNIQLDPALLDVNVHPAKTEIRFLKERRVFANVLRAVREALLDEPEMPQWQPGAARTSVEPSIEESESVQTEEDELLELDEVEETVQEPATPRQEVFPRDNPWLTVTEEETGTRPPLLARLWQGHVRSPMTTDEKTQTAPQPRQIPASRPLEEIQDKVSDAVRVEHVPEVPVKKKDQDDGRRGGEGVYVRRDDSWLPPQQQAGIEMIKAEDDALSDRRLPRLRLVGQVAQSYIVTEGEDGSMYLIDQHAAHERIVLEQMVSTLKSREPVTQLLLTPLELDLSPGELEAIEEYRDQLDQIGFRFEPGSDGTLAVLAVPGVLVKRMNAQSLHALLVELTAAESLGHTETWEERALANVACKAAIKANHFLTLSEMREMIEQLEQTKAPYSCCHGRPTMVHFSPSALATAFERR